jgi:hypothetical protein
MHIDIIYLLTKTIVVHPCILIILYTHIFSGSSVSHFDFEGVWSFGFGFYFCMSLAKLKLMQKSLYLGRVENEDSGRILPNPLVDLSLSLLLGYCVFVDKDKAKLTRYTPGIVHTWYGVRAKVHETRAQASTSTKASKTSEG